MQVSPISPERKYGAIIEGLNEEMLAVEDVRQGLRDLWSQHGLLVFRGNSLAPFHVALSLVFGTLEHHPAREMCHEDHPEIFLLRHDNKLDPWLYNVGGQVLGAWVPWHFDLAFVPHINRGSLLRSVKLPTQGGDTGFVDGVEAYERLDPDLREMIDGCEVIYKMESDFAKNKYVSRATRAPVHMERGNSYQKSMKARQEKDYPAVLHPAVVTQEETGRKVLHFSPLMASGIFGMSEKESTPILEALTDHVSDPTLNYVHHWTNSDIVMWDNWRMMHTAYGCPDGETREMWRTSIAGDYNLGRFLSDAIAGQATAKTQVGFLRDRRTARSPRPIPHIQVTS